MKLFIKNMVCDRCIMVVRSELEKLGLHPGTVTLGEAEITETELSPNKIEGVSRALTLLGFEIMDDRKSRIIEKIKNIIIQLVHHSINGTLKVNLSDHIAAELHYDYNYLSTLFSEVEGIPIEKYLIRQKIEKAKELLVYDELNISEIAYNLGYSSVSHLSSQFKQVTGFTPSHFKNIKERRKPLDKL
ncbi:MAG: helix-turn-helix transcriptional regulator [Taibaiella sp.]|nr:helix-turn-helix transcriptional regulator [Taibaiella sp.]